MYQLSEMRRKPFPRNRPRAERCEVCGLLLAVHYRNAERLERVYKVYKGNFRRVGVARKHRLAKKGAVHTHAVQPAHEFTFPPGLDRMGISQPMQIKIAVDDFVIDPGL